MKPTRYIKGTVLALALANGWFAAAQSNNVPGPDDYDRFCQFITQRNIFDPSRYAVAGQQRRITPRTPRYAPSFTLVGMMSYGKGLFAFFDGNSYGNQKALQKAGTIAGYTVSEIRPDSVKLTAGTNSVELKVGMQLRREEGGPWHVSAAAETYASTTTPAEPSASSPAASTDAAPSGPVSDILQRLMKQREQE